MYLDKILRAVRGSGAKTIIVAAIISFGFVTLIASAASTISTNVSTDGTLSVTGFVHAYRRFSVQSFLNHHRHRKSYRLSWSVIHRRFYQSFYLLQRVYLLGLLNLDDPKRDHDSNLRGSGWFKRNSHQQDSFRHLLG